MTDRVNMRMAGVPESSFSHWASKFLALGYKITKVDQAESSLALAKRKKDKGSAAVSKTVRRRVQSNAAHERERDPHRVRMLTSTVVRVGVHHPARGIADPDGRHVG